MKHDRHLLSLLFAASSSFFGPWPSPASAQLLGPEFQVNSYTTSSQSSPAIAPDGSGGFVVVWSSYLQDGSSTGVFGRRFDSGGLPVGGEFQVNSFTTGVQAGPAIAADGAGNFVVAWTSDDQLGSYEDMFGQRFDSAGLPLGSEFQINTYTTGQQLAPEIAVDGSGNVVMVWQSWWQAQYWDTFGQRFAPGGLPLGSEFRVNNYTSQYEYHPAVAADSAGNFVVVWNGRLQADIASQIFGRRFDSAGLPLGGDYQVSSYTIELMFSPAVAMDSPGNVVVVWQSLLQDGAGSGVFGQRFDSAGSPMGSEFQVNSYTPGDQARPDVAADGAGNFLVVWDGPYRDGSGLGVMGQRFDSAGLPLGSEFQINTYTTGQQVASAVAANGLGEFVVVWENDNQDGSWRGVFGQRVAFPFFYDGFESGDFGGWSSVCNDGDVCP